MQDSQMTIAAGDLSAITSVECLAAELELDLNVLEENTSLIRSADLEVDCLHRLSHDGRRPY